MATRERIGCGRWPARSNGRRWANVDAAWRVALAIALCACGSDGTGEGGRQGDGTAANGAGAANGGGAGNSGGAAMGSFGNPGATDTGGQTAQDGGIVGEAPDDREVCESAELVPMVEMVKLPGNILIVFDKSGSMKDPWGTGAASKWNDAIAAIPAALMPLQDDLAQVGAIFFPNPAPCSAAAINSGSQIDFMPGPAFLTAWSTYIMAAAPSGPTPLFPALQQADLALQNPALMNTTIVIVITDGAPNCAGGVSSSPEQLATLTPLPTTWFAKGIKTYVVGLPGTGDAAAQTLLNGVATAGGTGMYIPANDLMMLQTEIAKIVQESVKSNISCNIVIDPPPKNPDDVHVIVVEKGKKQDVPRDLGAGGGWTINADGTTIVLQGQFCKEAMDGTYEKISVEFGCVNLPPLPPPKPE